MTTVVIGIGNRTLSDDAVGCVVAERVGRTLGGNLAVEWREVHTGGLRLMEAMAGLAEFQATSEVMSRFEPSV